MKKTQNRDDSEKKRCVMLQSKKEKGWKHKFVNDNIFSVKLEGAYSYVLMVEVSRQGIVVDFGRLWKVQNSCQMCAV